MANTLYVAVYTAAATATWARADLGNGRNGWSASGYVASSADGTIRTDDGDETGSIAGLTAGTIYKLWAIVDDGSTSSNSGVPQVSSEFTTDVSAAAAFRSISSTTYATRTNTTVPAPAGIQDGDVLLLVFLRGNGGANPATPTWPSGFDLVSGYPTTVSDGTDYRVSKWVLKKVASGESGDYTVTHANGASQGVIVAVSGSDGTVVATQNAATTPAGTTTATATGLTTGADNSLVAFVVHNWDLYGAASPPTGSTPTFTERLDDASSLLYVATGVLATAGATGDKTHATGNSEALYPWSASLIEVRAGGGGGGAPAVEQDLAAAYAIANSAQQDLSAAYPVINAAAQDLSAAYAVRGAVEQDLAAAYAIASSAQQDLSAAYPVINAAAQDLSASYAVRGAVEQDLAAAYAIANSAQQDLSAAYPVINAAAKDLSASYVLVDTVQQNLAASYGVAGTVQQDLAAAFDILASGTVSSDFVAAYVVAGTVSCDFVAAYGIAAAAQQDVAANYAIVNAVAADRAATYAIVNAVAADRTGAYAILDHAHADLAASWSVPGAVSSDFAAAYTVYGGGGTGASADEIAETVWNWLIEGMRAREHLTVHTAALAGTSSGVGTDSETYYGRDGTTPRLVVTFDAFGNRASATLNGA